MKISHIICFAMAAFGLVGVAEAQSKSPKQAKIKAFVQIGKKPSQLVIERASGPGKFTFIPKGSVDQQMEMPVKSCGLFLLQTPADLAEALNLYKEAELEDARKRFATLRKKYGHYEGLPGDPSSVAALHEVLCAVRMLDWAGAKSLAEAFPSVAYDSLSSYEQAMVAAARIMGNIGENGGDATAQNEAVTALLKDKELGKSINSEVYGWLCYAKARAAAAKLPTDAISKDQYKEASAVVDMYCQAAVSHHGVSPEIPADAMKRAMNLLWIMPDVQAYAKKVQKPLNAKAWADAPADFRDAVAMAMLLKTVYAPDAEDELVKKLAPFFYNTAKDRAEKKDDKEAEKK